ncbi:hypothetical protein OPW07_00355 [Vibrio europaeus]|uniref:hypothetical protein n=1 Tax=Vibrio oreintalis group TaxID=1891919 RepID=UPI0018A6F25F|nr:MULTISPECIES: hypothetical protein [Vibrio oreintalis group]MCG9579738.1 hypothetical protein [Vibrio tubiashii]MDC5808176.1 hypothetical protein [Vibrio europaeus]QPG38200.1 hypothetical protein IXK98_24565 [Vibrio europaeus]
MGSEGGLSSHATGSHSTNGSSAATAILALGMMPSLSIDNILWEVRAVCLHASLAEARQTAAQPPRHSCAKHDAQPEH